MNHKKYGSSIIDLISSEHISGVSRKVTENMEVVEFNLRNKKIKISKTKQKKYTVISFEKNNIGGVIFSYGKFFVDKFGSESIQLFQEGLFRDREVGFLKIKKGTAGS